MRGGGFTRIAGDPFHADFRQPHVCVKVGSKTTKVGNSTFYNCEKLAFITMPATCFRRPR